MIDNKTISVAMTSFNGEKYIGKQIESILNQSIKADEIVVCDDCSTDHTLNLLQKYPITLIRNDTQLGFKKNFHQALSLCHGDYIFLCDQDDVWNKDKISKMVSVMETHPEIHTLASSFTYIDGNDNHISIKKMRGYSNNNLYPKKVSDGDLIPVSFNDLIYANFFQGCSLVLDRKTCNFVINHFDASIPHDWLINLYASTENSLYFYNVPLFQYRIHAENTLGIPDVNDNLESHAKRAATIEIRLQQPKASLQAIEIIKKNIPAFYMSRKKKIDHLYHFLIYHIRYVEHRRFFPLLFQNLDPCYHKLKTWRGRVMDLMFLLMHQY